jgi:hypothetical protein
MLVPLPRAASSRLISFLTFHISICVGSSSQQRCLLQLAASRGDKRLTFFSASLACASLIFGRLSSSLKGKRVCQECSKSWRASRTLDLVRVDPAEKGASVDAGFEEGLNGGDSKQVLSPQATLVFLGLVRRTHSLTLADSWRNGEANVPTIRLPSVSTRSMAIQYLRTST